MRCENQMKIKMTVSALMVGVLLVTMGCSNPNQSTSSYVVEMDSASLAQRAQDESVLAELENKKVTAEQDAEKAISDAKEANRRERNAIDASKQADEAFRTEKEAQQSRRQADEQAAASAEAHKKAQSN